MRIAVIDYELCDPEKCGFSCKRFCPVNRKGDECITIRERIVKDKKKEFPIINEGLCIGCGICVKKCPKNAISVVNTPEKLEETPIHRFGENGFILFGLPIPIKGVVGLLGANGTGKSTALKILSGKIKPNLGFVDEERGWEDVVKMYRGTEIQDYLERLSKNEIKAIVKPQQVSLIPNVISGYVYEFLKNVDDDLIKKLNLTNCLEREIKDLSGGELQKIAIAAAISKEADFYYFDEPSSYLDVKERLKVAKVIRELSIEKSVVVVEHDLATLDFLADRIHIFYGKPAVFGIVSKPYSVRNGINIFLNGYIAEENVRFREPTVFEEIVRESDKKNEVLVTFSNVEKKYDGFSLNIADGEIYKNEVLGIFGANALGKTTFAKILAGEVDYKGSIDRKIKISYKPQYIKTSNSFVRDLDINQSLIFKLDLEKLMDKSLEDLSGGELQRVAIAHCLSQEADMYLLDEPSAFLDVDQRLAVANLIKDKAKTSTCCIIDHDLLFLSYVADRAMLFSGISGKYGFAECLSLREGLNKFLKNLNITFRRDPETKRIRANKPNSVKDREQKERGEYFAN